MERSGKLTAATEMAAYAGFVWCAFGILLLAFAAAPQADGRPDSGAAFRNAAASVYGRLRQLPGLEKQVLAAGQPTRAAYYERMRDATRRRIDELMLEAEAAAATGAERARLARLAVLAGQADARAEQLRATMAAGRRSPPLAVLHD
jgi:hypothetical protein